jgi:hypothetical protein
LRAEEVIARYRSREQDWTRERQLSFERVAVLLLHGHKFPMQNNLNKCYKALGEVARAPTASAYCQARQKLKPEVFLYLNQLTCEQFYQLYGADGELRLWQGHRLLAGDGTYLNLPDSAETRTHYSVQTNQHESGSRVQALGSVLYDVLNDVCLSAGMSAKRGEREFLFETHGAQLQAGDLVILDRTYADSLVMSYLLQKRADFVIRCPRGGFTEVVRFWESERQEREVELRVPACQRKRARALGVALKVRVRLVKVVLNTGEVEVLATSLLNGQRYGRAELKQVYGLRWGIETYFDRVKNIFEVERWSGQTRHALEQDFYGVLFLTTLESILSRSAEAEMVRESQERETQSKPQVNHSVSYAALLDYLVELLLDESQSAEQVLAELEHLFQTNPTRRRPDRRSPRPPRSASQQLWTQRYSKRVIA